MLLNLFFWMYHTSTFALAIKRSNAKNLVGRSISTDIKLTFHTNISERKVISLFKRSRIHRNIYQLMVGISSTILLDKLLYKCISDELFDNFHLLQRDFMSTHDKVSEFIFGNNHMKKLGSTAKAVSYRIILLNNHSEKFHLITIKCKKIQLEKKITQKTTVNRLSLQKLTHLTCLVTITKNRSRSY